MAEQNSRWYIKYIVCSVIAAALCVFILANRNVLAIEEKKVLYQALSDAFCVPGVVMLLFGVLFMIARAGAFDGISYAMKRAVAALIPLYRDKAEKYADYKEKKDKKREADKSFGVKPMFITGALFFATSLVFLALFYSV